MDYYKLLEQQRQFFEDGNTRSVSFRKEQLQKLRDCILENEQELAQAVYQDFKKPEMEVVSGEILPLIDEIDFHLKNLKGWAKPKSARSNMLALPSKNEIRRVPFGVSLIIGAWNYPVYLLLIPLVGSITGGNCSVLKPSELAPATSAALRKIINSTFDREFISVVEGGVEVNQALLDLQFDKIFFTGSSRVGKIVMEKAAKNLIPVTLELGGKSPAVVHKDADIKTSAKRIAWGKFMNVGQTCIAPDFVLVHDEVKGEFVKEMKKAIKKLYGKQPKKSEDYGRIINQSHFQRIENLLIGANILHGGELDKQENYISPTVIDGVDWEHPIMKEEIFGPVLPIITYGDDKSPHEILRTISTPLALYIFSENDEFIEKVITNTPHGGTCVNDTIMHIVNPNIPFGGSGNSGMGQYHGKYSFECFTRPHAIMKRRTWPDPSFRYPPFGKKLYLLKKLFLR